MRNRFIVTPEGARHDVLARVACANASGARLLVSVHMNAFADPREVPRAIAYYRALSAQAQVVFRASPYGREQRPVAFGFDWSFDSYPLAYHRPGPQMTVYRLRGGRCGL